MKLLHRFILQHFLHVLLLCISAFCGIYLLIDFFERGNDLIEHQAEMADYLSYLLNSIPLIFTQILPLAILMSVVLTLGGLSRTNELTALRACGIGLWRIVQPLMLLALILSGILLFLNEFVAPHNASALNQLFEVKLKGKELLPLTRNEIWFRSADKIINVRLSDPGTKKLHGVTLFVLDQSSQIKQRLETGLAVYDGKEWIAEKLMAWDFDPQTGDMLTTTIQQNKPLLIDRTPQDFVTQERQGNELTYRQLSKLASKLEKEGLDATRYRVDKHNRLASPFTCLVMGFLGIPFALQKGRQSNIALGIGQSLGIGVIYFIMQSMITALSYSGALHPIIAAWSTNIIFLMLGIWMLLNVKE